MSRRFLRPIAMLFAVMLLAAACGSDSDETGEAAVPADTADTTAGDDAGGDDAAGDDASDGDAASGERPTIAVTTNILGDVVTELVGDQADVMTVMPVGADPHDFQASAQEVDAVLSADALIVNGADFEEGLVDVIGNAVDEGVPTHEAMEGLATLEFGEGGHDHSDEEGHDHGDEEKDEDGHDHSDEEGHDHGDEEKDEDGHDHSDEEGHDHSDEEKDEDGHDHSDEEGHDHGDDHGDDHGHSHDGDDPHFFTDPVRMADAVDGIATFLADVEGIDQVALDTAVAAYLAELEALDAEVTELVDGIPDESRVLITNHEVFAYFADQYGFEVVGTIIPSGSTADGASAGELAELAEVIEDEGVPAIFSDTSASDELAQTLADEVGDVAVVELYTESLGEEGSDGATYLDMVRTNAERIAAALA
ncbi:MAG: zinc ABC transporter substrate-binding protein [Actinomycetota bacterium]